MHDFTIVCEIRNGRCKQLVTKETENSAEPEEQPENASAENNRLRRGAEGAFHSVGRYNVSADSRGSVFTEQEGY